MYYFLAHIEKIHYKNQPMCLDNDEEYKKLQSVMVNLGYKLYDSNLFIKELDSNYKDCIKESDSNYENSIEEICNKEFNSVYNKINNNMMTYKNYKECPYSINIFIVVAMLPMKPFK
ncbi:hypothetical protein [Brachyspira hyodysenteriae]|uniref:hypothetical protein n=1 Tax=Brachyspira hyodysenteriae TaxID=159 RepID=UPI00063D8AB4|nr:hypothetical protein [Brachyspira hyodysenteriae]KLI32598.1 hypothetical protein SZ48_10640 [Brachyspira hyodysenteriae]